MSIDSHILRALRAADGRSVSGGDLAQQLGVTRAAVWARIEELRALGYQIDASPHEGYRLTDTPDLLHADDLMSRLAPDRVIGRDIRVFTETTSTNDVVERLARDGVAEGVVVFAESQTRGRGRLGRRWISPPRKGLWFSVLLRPKLRPQEATQLTIGGAVALVRAFRSHLGIAAQIKWPNDVLVGDRKVAGILTELSAELDQLKFLILGIGVDVNLSSDDFPPQLRHEATSLRIAAGHPIDRASLADAILTGLDRVYAGIQSGRFADIAAEWEHACNTLGRDVTIRLGDRCIQGRAESLDPDGALLLRSEHGRLERIVGGDVTLDARHSRP